MKHIKVVALKTVRISNMFGSLFGPYPFKFFNGCLPQILLGSILNTLSHLSLWNVMCQLIKITKVQSVYQDTSKVL